MVTHGYDTAKAILSANIHILHALAQELMEREELNAEEIDRLVTMWGEPHSPSKEISAVV
jgi:ATP-dependent Zn protease